MAILQKHVAILVYNYFEQAEFTGPKKALLDAGVKVEVVAAGAEDEKIQGLNHVEMGDKFSFDKTLEEVTFDDYDALILPGGAINADHLRMEEKARQWIVDFCEANKPLAVICHAPWVLVSAGVAKGRKITSYFTIQDDIRNAGASWLDKEVVVDDNIITSRNPDDIPAFNSALLKILNPA